MRTFTCGDIIDRALRRADMYGSNYISPEEQFELLNMAYTDLYDILTTTYEEYNINEEIFALTPGTYAYDLPADFYKGVGVDYQINMSTTSYITLKPYTEMERNGLTGIIGQIPSGNIRLRYIPAPQTYTSRLELINGVSGWEEIIVVIMAIAMKEKEESNTASLERRLQMLIKRITDAANNRDTGFPHRVNDTYRVDIYQQFATLRYQFSGDTIRFLPTVMLGAAYSGIAG